MAFGVLTFRIQRSTERMHHCNRLVATQRRQLGALLRATLSIGRRRFGSGCTPALLRQHVHIDHGIAQITLCRQHNAVHLVGGHRAIVPGERWLRHHSADASQATLQQRTADRIEGDGGNTVLGARRLAEQRVGEIQLATTRIGADEHDRRPAILGVVSAKKTAFM